MLDSWFPDIKVSATTGQEATLLTLWAMYGVAVPYMWRWIAFEVLAHIPCTMTFSIRGLLNCAMCYAFHGLLAAKKAA